MSGKQEKAQIEQLKRDLKAAKQNHASKVRASDYQLLKLALLMVVLVIVAAFIYGRIHI